ncbi:dioxygenase family protein [Aestuariispira insulae]|uniref:4,5-DOPA dioxygenase extradiol n=1 Tax=Aestuariispira insulae TaxID=1461337 RepID=A0A3D9HXI9_9PROT|nr:class III extradiol ring-cleavage dioxygenase [Aestuariispira insulae]RED54218.1 4,5-DOPA dioxygenase extradiol [Aestuariispira insulae]
MKRIPSLFVSHGAPTLALDPGIVGENWRAVAGGFPKPEGILVISAHWEAERPTVSITEKPETIHDFYGFPAAMYEMDYPAPGAPDLAGRVRDLIDGGGLDVAVDQDRGVDHGAWVPLMQMFPDADIPVAQLSVQPALGLDHHFTLGRILAPLRQQGTLILASGALTHNLADFRHYQHDRDGPPLDYVQRFEDWVTEKVEAASWDCLMHLDYAPDYRRNHPTVEHILPLLVAAGTSGGPGRSFSESYAYRILSMKGFIFD